MAGDQSNNNTGIYPVFCSDSPDFSNYFESNFSVDFNLEGLDLDFSLGESLDLTYDAGSAFPILDGSAANEVAAISTAAEREPLSNTHKLPSLIAPFPPEGSSSEEAKPPKYTIFFIDPPDPSFFAGVSPPQYLLADTNPSSWDMLKNEDLIEYPSNVEDKPWTRDAREFPSILSVYDLARVHYLTMFRPFIQVRLPSSSERACSSSDKDWVCYNYQHSVAGLRYPFPSFLLQLLDYFNIALSQLYPNAIQNVLGFIGLCRFHQVEPSLHLFKHFFCVKTLDRLKDKEYGYIRRPGPIAFFSKATRILGKIGNITTVL